MKNKVIGFTAGTFDLFHIGHLNLLKEAKKHCDYLIVGVNKSELVKKYKNVETVISDENRLRIVEAIKYVDEVHLMDTLDKMAAYDLFKFDITFIGDDWKGSARWNENERILNEIGVQVFYLSYTEGISSTMLRAGLGDK